MERIDEHDNSFTEGGKPRRRQGEVRQIPGRHSWVGPAAFILMHVACLAVFFTGAGVLALSLCGACYLLQMVGITVGYHRYFSHRSFKTSRAFQFVLACLGCSASQRGPLWWTAHHRHHHRTSDTPDDLHSPIAHSFWWSHIGWVLSADSDGMDDQAVRDLQPLPRAALARPLSLGASHCAGCAVPGHRRLERAGLGLRR